MKSPIAFIFFMLFLAGIAFVNLKGMNNQADTAVNSASDIATTAWRPTHIGEMRIRADSQMIVQFNLDNTVVGHGGCNRFFGDYRFVESTLKIGPLGSTRMACPEPGNSFEISFLDALQSARILAHTETRLAMRDEQGVVVARFVATERDDADK